MRPGLAHSALTDELRDQASLFSLGLLDGEEAAHFEAHLEQCSTCAEEVRACTEVVAGVTAILAESEPAAPPASIKEQLMRRIAPPEPTSSDATTTYATTGVIVRAEEGRWHKVMPGIEVKRLFVDPLTKNITSLLRVAAGAVYPAHRHAGLEHLYVVDGDAIFDDHTLNTGDYEARTPNSVHSMVRTTEGCLLLVIHNQHDEYL
jgi:anti-sigma factor ChrR (cupin superfamily)